MNRRDFLAAAVTVPAGFRPRPAAARDPKRKPVATPNTLPIVDTHQHLWDLSKLKLSWIDPDAPADGNVLARSYTPKDYAEATAGLNVVKAVYMEVDVVPEDQQKEVDYVVGLCASGKTPTCAGVLGGRPNADGFAEYVKQFKGHKYVKGIRQVLHVGTTHPDYYLDPKFVTGIRLLGDLGLSFDLCVHPAELPDHCKLIDRCPDARFVLDHCGNANLQHTPKQREQWKKGMAEIAGRKNVVGKVSGFIATAPARGKWTLDDLAPVIDHTLAVFGPDRVMYGGDWPVCLKGVHRYADWLNALKTVVADRPEDQQKKLFHDNAVAFYGL